MNKFLEFSNIKEIVFKQIKNNTFSININSDINISTNETMKNANFKADICTINPSLQLYCTDSYSQFSLPNNYVTPLKSFQIPIEINLLVDENNKSLFEVSTNQEKEYLGIYNIKNIEVHSYKILANNYSEAKEKFLNRLLKEEIICNEWYYELLEGCNEELNIIPLFDVETIE